MLMGTEYGELARHGDSRTIHKKGETEAGELSGIIGSYGVGPGHYEKRARGTRPGHSLCSGRR